jgi:hypothetical protein
MLVTGGFLQPDEMSGQLWQFWYALDLAARSTASENHVIFVTTWRSKSRNPMVCSAFFNTVCVFYFKKFAVLPRLIAE